MSDYIGVIRAVLSALGGVLVVKGYGDESTIQALVGAVLVFIQGGWSIYEKKAAKKAA
jgi:hypothetical protein